MRTSAIIRICVWAFVALLCLGVLMNGLADNRVMGLSIQRGSLQGRGSRNNRIPPSMQFAVDGEMTFSPSKVRKIDIDWVADSVQIDFVDCDEIVVSEMSSGDLSENEKYQVKLDGDTLKIDYCKRTVNIMGNKDKSLYVSIPHATKLSSLEIDGVSNSVFVEGMGATVGKIDIETTSGYASIQNIVAKELEMDTVSGMLEASGTFSKVDLETISGSISLHLHRTPKSIKTSSVSGSVDVILPGETGFAAKLDTVSGSLSVDAPTVKEGKKQVYGDGSAQFSFESISGSVQLLLDTSSYEEMEVPADAWDADDYDDDYDYDEDYDYEGIEDMERPEKPRAESSGKQVQSIPSGGRGF